MEDLLYCSETRPGRKYGFFKHFFLLNFGGAFSASVPRAYLNHKPLVFSALHRKYTDSFIAAGLVAEIPELSGNLIAKCQILVSENNHVGVKGRDIQARQGWKQNTRHPRKSKRIFKIIYFGVTEKRLKRRQCKLNCAACKMGGLVFILRWYSLF